MLSGYSVLCFIQQLATAKPLTVQQALAYLLTRRELPTKSKQSMEFCRLKPEWPKIKAWRAEDLRPEGATVGAGFLGASRSTIFLHVHAVWGLHPGSLFCNSIRGKRLQKSLSLAARGVAPTYQRPEGEKLHEQGVIRCTKYPATYLLEYWITIMTKQPANESLLTWHQLVTASDTYITCRTYYKVSNNWACIETDNCYKFQFNQLSDKGWKATTSHRGQQRQVRFTFTATQATVARFLLRSLY